MLTAGTLRAFVGRFQRDYSSAEHRYGNARLPVKKGYAMVFLGDIAHPFNAAPKWRTISTPWSNQAVVANLEGPIVTQAQPFLDSERVLVNDVSVIPALFGLGVRAVTLANNHITDVPGGVARTVAILRRNNILTAGAGRTEADAATPIRLGEGKHEYILLAFGWQAIQCRASWRTGEGVNLLQPARVLAAVERVKQKYPRAALVLLMHWNYEFEIYPQPAHRQLALAAVDAGANAVIGHHPHCVGGLEVYRGAPVAYSLGNWWIPRNVFFGGRLTYPGLSDLQLALEWSVGREPVLHWFHYQHEDHDLKLVASGPATISQRISTLTPFVGMSHREYVDWFRRNRRVRKLLPVYDTFRAPIRNWAKDLYVGRLRHAVVTGVRRIGLRK